MRRLALVRRARALVAVGTAAALLAASPIAASVATAETSGQADAKAQQLLAQVHRLQRQVAAAEKQYDDALAGVAQSVMAAVSQSQASDELSQQESAAEQQLDDRVRGLYMSGGPLAIYATLLDSGDPTQLQEQAILVNSLVTSDQGILAVATRAAADAATAAASLQKRAHARIRTERTVSRSADRVLSLMAQEQALLAQAQARAASIRQAEEALAAQAATFSEITASRIAAMRVLPPSATYLALYHRAAATCPGLSWTVLAAIGQVESGHGRDPSTSYAGAMGPMQFMPATFAAYAVDGDHDGQKSIMDPADAIFTAARYLCANGGGGGSEPLARAIFHYNHADWYVAMVLALAKQYAA